MVLTIVKCSKESKNGVKCCHTPWNNCKEDLWTGFDEKMPKVHRTLPDRTMTNHSKYHGQVWSDISTFDMQTIIDLDIPILTRKNTLVSVKECGTGHILNQPAPISFPRDSAMHTIDHQHSSWTDDQGMAFFYLQPDIFIPYGVTATGYISYHSSLSLSANGTHFVEVNLCPMVRLS